MRTGRTLNLNDKWAHGDEPECARKEEAVSDEPMPCSGRFCVLTDVHMCLASDHTVDADARVYTHCWVTWPELGTSPDSTNIVVVDWF